MLAPLECPDCGRDHDEPADATLGRRVLCLDCFFEREAGRAARAGGFDTALRPAA